MSATETRLKACALLHEVSDIVLQHTLAATELAVHGLEACVDIVNQASCVASLIGFGSFAHEVFHLRVAKCLVKNHPAKALKVILYHGSIAMGLIRLIGLMGLMGLMKIKSF